MTITQPEIFDVAGNLAYADPWWKSRVAKAIETLIATRQPFTSDDVFDEDRFGIEQPTTRGEKNHVGSIFAHLALSGQVVEVGRRRSTRPAANGRKVTIWLAAGTELEVAS